MVKSSAVGGAETNITGAPNLIENFTANAEETIKTNKTVLEEQTLGLVDSVLGGITSIGVTGATMLATTVAVACVAATYQGVIKNHSEARQAELDNNQSDRAILQNIEEEPPAQPVRRTKKASEEEQEEPARPLRRTKKSSKGSEGELKMSPKTSPFRPSTLEPDEQ
jgi:hypothetical protein